MNVFMFGFQRHGPKVKDHLLVATWRDELGHKTILPTAGNRYIALLSALLSKIYYVNHTIKISECIRDL